ncbi:MAG: hypothetical protein ACXW3H_07845 [Candidatus Aminicenantales bacterium]
MKDRRSAVAGIVLALSLILIPAAGHSQTWRGLELQRLMRDAPWHFGPFIIQPALVIANAGRDSNLYYTPSNPVKDFTLTAGPAATFYVPIHRKFVLSVYGSPQYVWYSKTERERTWNYYFKGSAQLDFKNAFFSVDGVYSDARERYSTEIDIRPRRKELGYGGSALLKLAWKTSFAMSYRTVKYNYESIDYAGFNLRERLNRQESYANLSLYYQAAEDRRFFIDLEYGRYNFEFAAESALRDAESGAVFGGLEFSRLGRRVRGRLRLGYKKFDPLRAGTSEYQGLVGDTLLSFRLAKILSLRGSYLRDVQFSIWYGDAYYIETRPGVGASLYPLPFLRLDYDYSRGQNRYPVAGGGGTGVARLDRYDIHSGALYCRIMKNTALGFVVSWWARTSNIPGQDDQRTFYGLNLTYDF